MLASKMEYMGDATWWDERFRNRKNVLMLPEEKLKSDLKYFAESKKILDLACGDGRNAIFLAKMGYEVYAVIVNHYRMAREIYPFIKPVTSSSEFVVKYSCKVLFSSCKWHIL